MAKSRAAEVAAATKKAGELKRELRRLVRAIAENDDIQIKTFDEAARTIVAIRDVKFSGNRSSFSAIALTSLSTFFSSPTFVAAAASAAPDFAFLPFLLLLLLSLSLGWTKLVFLSLLLVFFSFPFFHNFLPTFPPPSLPLSLSRFDQISVSFSSSRFLLLPLLSYLSSHFPSSFSSSLSLSV